MDATSASAGSASAGAPAGGDLPANQKGKRKVIDSDLESGEESSKIRKENEITVEEVVAAPLAFATPSETAFIQRANPVEFNRALDYISLIKNHFASSSEVYQQFIRIVNSTKVQKDQDRIGAILDEVALLFDTQAKLLEGFVYFLPK
jgi:histone deacetylase complex regulatory component SIN3